ncbi:fibroblast growth factor receptor 2-like isoform X3 [Apostichopus japonicus]|uniref:fibroblast growth factor receptor 2-like isoform X3 n=1 Tax=Stichopus japonicus TaxID=307972 RepID=UPI003AB7EB8E
MASELFTLFCFISAILISLNIASSHAQLTTCFQQENVLDIVKTCHSEAGGDVCLVCPVKLSSTADVLWTRGNSSIYAGTNKLVRDVNLRINSCSTDLSSLRISNVTIKNVNEKYYCQRITNAEWNAGFILDIIDYILETTSGTAPVSTTNILVPMCILLILLSASAIVTAIVISRKKRLKRRRRDKMAQPLPKLPKQVDENEEYVLYDTVKNEEDFVYFYGDSVVYHRTDIVLSKSLPNSGRMMRWIGSFQNANRPAFVASTLHEDASRNDWCEFRVFSQYLRNMPKHMNIVDIVGCDTEKVPHYIYMEYLTNGTLLDFLLDTSKENDYSTAIYDKRIRPFSLTRDARQLATFSSQILEALMFLETVDCDHLGICARKVLLDNNTNCKLYDFNLCSATTKILSNINLEVSPCLKWFAPETIVNREYSQNSNIWSYAVFMWEVFSMGKTPFEKLDLEGLKSAINIQPPLPQNNNWPNVINTVITACLRVDPDTRMKALEIRESLDQFLDENKQDDNEYSFYQ